tara:strand:- start:3706 stop:4506 length:801 start_codon:yes stop_codon:yes gene_type:complete
MFTHFYHEKIRKVVATFGTMFNNLHVVRKDASGASISQMKVPLAYAPRQKFLDRIRETSEFDDSKVAVKLPRMSFEMSALYFDPTRQLPKVNNFTRQSTSTSQKTKFFTSVPYILNFQLNILAKTNEDAVQILEQILPFFNPSYTVTMKQFSDYTDITEDIPITLIGISFSDDYEGQLENRRTIIYTLDFEIKTNFYGPIADAKIIRKAIVDFRDPDNPTQGSFSLTDSDNLIERITVEPDPINVSPDSDYGFTETYFIPGEGDSA